MIWCGVNVKTKFYFMILRLFIFSIKLKIFESYVIIYYYNVFNIEDSVLNYSKNSRSYFYILLNKITYANSISI